MVHYWSGRNIFEENPVDYSVIGEIRKYQITFSEHSNDYDFYNSESLMDDFLLNVKNIIKRSESLVDEFLLNVEIRIKRSDSDFLIRCGFSLENIQLSLFENEELIASSQ